MTDLAFLAAVSFIQVFALGFQSRNVNSGHYAWAAATSFFIGISQVLVWRHITAPDAGWLAALIYAASGSIGIVFAMATHSRFIGKKRG